MFAKLTNEAILTFTLRNEGPLLINSGSSAKIHPRPDMSFVRTVRDGKETVYLPGSSLKGVFRSRYEQIMRALGQDDIKVCNVFDKYDNCNSKIQLEERKFGSQLADGEARYKFCCEACKLFGSLALGGRLTFADAYPIGEWKVGMRHGVGIDRISGAASPGALYDIESLEAGSFTVKCKMTNFRLYQLRMILWILEDIQDGLVTFGMGGSRGNGQMRIVKEEKVELIYRKYPNDATDTSSFGEGKDELFGKKITMTGLSSLRDAFNINTKEQLTNAIREGR